VLSDSTSTRQHIVQWIGAVPPGAASLQLRRFRRALPGDSSLASDLVDEVLQVEPVVNEDRRRTGMSLSWHDAHGRTLDGFEVFPLQSIFAFEAAILPAALATARARGIDVQLLVEREYLTETGPRVVEHWPASAPGRSVESLDVAQPVFSAAPAGPATNTALAQAGAKLLSTDSRLVVRTDQPMPWILKVVFVVFIGVMLVGFWWVLLPSLLFSGPRQVARNLLSQLLGRAEAYEYRFDPDALVIVETGRNSVDERIAWGEVLAASLAPTDAVLPGAGTARLRLIGTQRVVDVPVAITNVDRRLAVQRALKAWIETYLANATAA
jgi:hypothetical protein